MTKTIIKPTMPPAAVWHTLPATRNSTPKRPLRFWFAWAAAALGALAAVVLFVLWPKPVPSTETLIYGATATQQEGFPTALPAQSVSRAQALAATGGGSVVGVVAAGSSGQQVGAPVSLRIEDDGQLENDPQTRAAAITSRMNGLLTAMKTAAPASDGRSLTGLLAGVAAALGAGPNQVWLETFGLPTAAGEDARVLMAADPAAAAAAIPASAITPLKHADVHIVLLPAAGDQPSLTATTDLWRKAFVADVVRRTGARVAEITEDTVPSAPAADAPPAPPVPNISVTTPQPKRKPTPPAPGKPLSISLDTSTAFQPDSARWADGTSEVRQALIDVVTAWSESKHQLTVTVTGYCARFGPAAGAIALSRQRAEQVATLLRSMGVPVTASNVTGNGYADPLPDPNPQSPNNRTVVVTARTTQ